MKRYDDLYPQICSKENLYLAHINARKGKAHYVEVIEVNKNESFYIDSLHEMLISNSFQTAPYKTKQIHEPKERTIYKLPYYPDRILHHAIMQVLQPIWDKTFIYDLYSAIPGKGLHAGSYRLRRFLQDVPNTQYCLKMDISKYYPSINHDIMFEIVQRKIKCKDTLQLLEEIIRSPEGNTNLPIGNYLSQYLSNLYLSDFDHWIKEENGMKYYLRYCDDSVILSPDKNELKLLLFEITDYLENNLELTLNKKTQIFPVDSRGIDFLGYRHFRHYTLLRSSSARRLKKCVKNLVKNPEKYHPQSIISSIMAYNGWLQHCDAQNLLCSTIYTSQVRDIVEKASEELKIMNPLEKLCQPQTQNPKQLTSIS